MNIKTERSAVGFYAYDADTYCGCGECSEVGGGLTEQEAIDDLLEQIEDGGVPNARGARPEQEIARHLLRNET